MMDIISIIAEEIGARKGQVEAAVKLIDEGFGILRPEGKSRPNRFI